MRRAAETRFRSHQEILQVRDYSVCCDCLVSACTCVETKPLRKDWLMCLVVPAELKPRSSELDAGTKDIGMVRRGVFEADSGALLWSYGILYETKLMLSLDG